MDRAREAVRNWRAQHPDGTADQLVADLGGRFFRGEWAPVLRSLLCVQDRHAARAVCGIISGPAEGAR